MDDYYVIKTLMNNEDSWDSESLIYHYIYGKSSYFQWIAYPADARKFKTIREIRAFITNGLRSRYNNSDINSWVFERIITIPSREVFTSSHTMELLRKVE